MDLIPLEGSFSFKGEFYVISVNDVPFALFVRKDMARAVASCEFTTARTFETRGIKKDDIINVHDNVGKLIYRF